MTVSIMTISIMTLNIMTLGIMTLSIMTLSIMTFSIAVNKTQHSPLWQSIAMLSVIYADCHLC